MLNNDILRRLRYALDISDVMMARIFRLGDYVIEVSALPAFLKKEDEEGYVECNNAAMAAFLDGFIIYRRGPKETDRAQEKKPRSPLSNNIILKKLRIALDLKEDDMTRIFGLAGVEVSKSEMTALFRRETHKNYKECGDQFLRNFLKGLTIHFRK